MTDETKTKINSLALAIVDAVLWLTTMLIFGASMIGLAVVMTGGR